jgi:hypothetical protein
MPKISRPRHATIVAYLALLVALSGTAYSVGAGSIGSKELKKNAVVSSKIKNGQVKTKDLRDGSVTSTKLGKDQPVLRWARVTSTGTLVDGTAASAAKSSDGIYVVTFPQPIDGCAAAAGPAAYRGFDTSVFRVNAFVQVGLGGLSGTDNTTVSVQLYRTSDGASVNSAFTLTLVCPRT